MVPVDEAADCDSESVSRDQHADVLFKRSHTGCGMMVEILGGKARSSSCGIRVGHDAGVVRSDVTREE